MAQHRMRHVALQVAYLGHDYHGLAAQEAGVGSSLVDGIARQGGRAAPAAVSTSQVKTIEAAIFAALVQSCLIESREESGYTRCGRTDKGVSAAGQVMALRLRSKSRRFDAATGEGAGAASGPASGSEVQQPWLSSPIAPVHPYWTEPSPFEDSVEFKQGLIRDALQAAVGHEGARHSSEGDGEGGEGDGDAVFFRRWSRAGGLSNTGAPFPPPADEMDYAQTLNGLLPPEIRVLGWADIPDDFSARFSTTLRTYRYYFPYRRAEMDLERLRDAARRLQGVHDFRNFAKIDIANTQNFVREVVSVRVLPAASAEAVRTAFPALGARGGDAVKLHTPQAPAPAAAEAAAKTATEANAAAGLGGGVDDAPVYYLEVRGRAFLWHQVRCMAAVLFHVARGFEAPSVVDHLLDVARCPARPNYTLAPEAPLVLYHCSYGEEKLEAGAAAPSNAVGSASPGEEEGARPTRFLIEDAGLFGRMHHSPAALRKLTLDLERQWSALALKASMLRGVLDRVYALPVAVPAPELGSAEDTDDVADPASKRARRGTVLRPWREVCSDPALLAQTAALTQPQQPQPPFLAADADYVIQGLPAARFGAHEGKESKGIYVPFAARSTGQTVEDKWRSMSTQEKAKIAAMHPYNAKRFAEKLQGQETEQVNDKPKQ
jgi:tRNA U38,U39,U40 pseudouridine synthase TruA